MDRPMKLEVKSKGRVAVSIESERPELILEFLESFYLEPWWDSIELRQGRTEPTSAQWRVDPASLEVAVLPPQER